MPTFIVLFQDNEEFSHKRQQHMADHLDFLTRHRDKVRAAGPLIEAKGGKAAGGLWLMDASDSDAVMEFVKEDPFWSTGLREEVRILEWKQVFRDGKSLISTR